MIKTHLLKHERELSSFVGKARHHDSRLKGLSHADNIQKCQDDNEVFFYDILGAMGEMAVAKALGVYWGGSVGTYQYDGDVMTWEVKTISYHKGHLSVNFNNPRDRWYILCQWNVPYQELLEARRAGQQYWLLMSGKYDSFSLVGYQWGEVICKPENIGNLGRGQSYVYHRDRLIKEWRLADYPCILTDIDLEAGEALEPIDMSQAWPQFLRH